MSSAQQPSAELSQALPKPDRTEAPNGTRLRRLGIHGPRQSGKTSYLTVLNRFRKSGEAAAVILDDHTVQYLTELWERYLAVGQHTPRTAGLPSEIRFDLQADGRTWEILSRDYPGERVQRPVDAETLAWLESCDAILVFVDVTSTPNQLSERINEVDLLLGALRQLSHDGNTIARPLGLVLTKWDTLGPIAPSAPAREDQRAHSFLEAHTEFRQLYHALLQAGHPDRVKVFPLSSFGENRQGTEPPEGGPRAPLNLHAPLVWALRLADERLVETAHRRSGEALKRWWPDLRSALAEYDHLVLEKGINKGHLFDDEIEPARVQLRQRLRRRRLVLLACCSPLLVLAVFLSLLVWDAAGYRQTLTALGDPERHPEQVAQICQQYTSSWNPLGRLLGHAQEIEGRVLSSLRERELQEFSALEVFCKDHAGEGDARSRAERSAAFRDRWPGSEHLPQVQVWESDALSVASLYEQRTKHQHDYEALEERVKTLASQERHDAILEEYDRFLKRWDTGAFVSSVRERKAEALSARDNRAWGEVVRLDERSPKQHELITSKIKPFLTSQVPAIRGQAQKMLNRHELAWDREEYESLRKACAEARSPEDVKVAHQRADDYVRATYPPHQRKEIVQRWLRWYEGLHKEDDYHIKVVSVDIPSGSQLVDRFTNEQVKVHVRIGGTVHSTEWYKGPRSINVGEVLGPFRSVWGKEETIEITVEEYDNLNTNDKSVGRKTDGTFALLFAQGTFVTRCSNDKDVKVYLECAKVVPPTLPAFDEK